jgi:sec-independent protein translocase protein TatA
MGELSPWHLLIVAGIFVLLYGSKRLPAAARSLGKSMRIMKTELQGLHDDDTALESTTAPVAAPPPDASDPTDPPA